MRVSVERALRVPGGGGRIAPAARHGVAVEGVDGAWVGRGIVGGGSAPAQEATRGGGSEAPARPAAGQDQGRAVLGWFGPVGAAALYYDREQSRLLKGRSR